MDVDIIDRAREQIENMRKMGIGLSPIPEKTPEEKAAASLVMRNWCQRPENKPAVIAYTQVKRALKTGELKKCPCLLCLSEGEKKNPIQAHHEDYSRPLDVIWVCRKHHHQLHVEKRQGLEQELIKIIEDSIKENRHGKTGQGIMETGIPASMGQSEPGSNPQDQPGVS